MLWAFVFIPFHWGFGGAGGKKKRKGEGRDCGKLSTFSLPCCICTVVAVYETAKMLLAQPTDSISNSEEMFFVWYAVNLVPVYLHNLQCSICGRKCDVIEGKKMNATSCKYSKILKRLFCLVYGTLGFSIFS